MIFLIAVGSFAALIAVELMRRRIVNYRTSIRYDIRSDYVFKYDRNHGIELPLSAVPGGLVWPSTEGEWHSAFLEIEIETTIVGRIVDPYLETELAGSAIRHYFERGAAGNRILNLSGFLGSSRREDQTLQLSGYGVRARPASARLHLLRSAGPPETPILALAPHPDDAEIAAFGLLSTYSHDAWVVTITVGDHGPSKYGDFFSNAQDDYREKARVRSWDSATIPQMAGISSDRIFNLGYFDGTLKRMFRAPDNVIGAAFTGLTDVSTFRVHPREQHRGPRASNWRNLVEDLERLLREIRPRTIIAPHPQLDPHGDHQYTTIALIDALGRVGLTEGRLLLYVNHAIGSELYPYGAKDGAVSIPPVSDPRAYYQTVLSLPLEHRTRLHKQIAIEAQHDLRPAVAANALGFNRVLRDSIRAPYDHIVEPNTDYVRRAVRPNEIFFVVDFTEAGRLRDEFLGHSSRH